jgi:tripartite-type tricarboxylate transporter receptor subunit TctC
MGLSVVHRCMGNFAIRALILAAVLFGIASTACAQVSYPIRPITMVVPFAAGGPTDVMGRILAQHMSQTLGQQIIIENVTGAGGTLGALRVARAAPDGYTMVLGNLGTHAAALGIYKSLSYDPRTDFEPAMIIGNTPMVLVVKNGLPVATLKDVIALAKSGKVTFGSAGIGSISHLTLILFNSLTKAQAQHVPYRGLSQAVNDVLAGQIDGVFDQVVTAVPHIRSGGEKAIAVTAMSRTPQLPNVPTSIEAGLPDLQTNAWTALFFPKGTPKAIVARMNAAVDSAMQVEAIARQLEELGAELPPPNRRTPQALADLVHAEVDKWVPVIRATGVAE